MRSVPYLPPLGLGQELRAFADCIAQSCDDDITDEAHSDSTLTLILSVNLNFTQWEDMMRAASEKAQIWQIGERQNRMQARLKQLEASLDCYTNAVNAAALNCTHPSDASRQVARTAR